MSESDPSPARSEQPMSVRQVFARYGDPDYVLVPHRRPAARRMYRHRWLIVVAYALLALVMNVGALLSSPSPAAVGSALLLFGPRHVFMSYQWADKIVPATPAVAEDDPSCWWQSAWRFECVPVKRSIPSSRDEDLVLRRYLIPADRFDTTFRIAVLKWLSDRPEVWLPSEPGSPEVCASGVCLDLMPYERTTFAMVYLTLMAAVPVLLMALVWWGIIWILSRRFPRALYELGTSGRLRPPAATESIPARRWGSIWPRSWHTFVDDLEHAVTHPLRFALFVLCAGVFILLAAFIVEQLGARGTPVPWSTAYGVSGVGLGMLIIAYAISFDIWHALVLAGYLYRLVPLFRVHVQPDHGDGCGGMARLGQLSLLFAALIMTPSVTLAFLWYMGVLTINFALFFTGGIITLLLIFLTPLAFFGPLWRVHDVMSAARDRYQEEAVTQIAPLERRLRALIASGRGESEEGERLERQLTRLKELYRRQHDFPTWPFSSAQLLGLATGQLAPVLSLVVALVERDELVERVLSG